MSSKLAPTVIGLLALALSGCGGGEGPGDDRWCAPPGHEGPVSCPSGEDTCTPGKNTTNARVEGGLEDSGDAQVLAIRWDAGDGRGAELPEAYFEAVKLDPDAEPGVVALVKSVEYLGARTIEVRFDAAALASYLETSDALAFSLLFPDRAAFIECTHPGMTDRYLLDVELGFAAGKLASSSVEERLEVGDI